MLVARTIVVLGLASVVVLFSMTVIADTDFWWHLQLGESILRTGSLPASDAFSYTFRGQPQFNAEWLGELAWAVAYRLGGFAGINLLKAAVIAGVLLLLHATFRLRSDDEIGPWFASVLTLLLVLFALRFRMFPRPTLFSFVFLAAALHLVVRYDVRRTTFALVGLPVLELVWANTSKAAFLGATVAGVYALGQLLEGTRDRRAVLAALAVLVASMINPEGGAVYRSLLGVAPGFGSGAATGSGGALSFVFMEVGEHQPLSAQLLWGHGFRYTWAFQLVTITALAYLLLLGGWRRPHQILWFLVFLAPAGYAIRLIGFSCIVSAIFVFETVSRILAALPGQARVRRWGEALVTVALLAVCAFSTFRDETYRLGVEPKQSSVPEGAIRFLERHRISGTMFNSYPFGGYLIWRAPDRAVFVDGRAGQLYSQRFLEEYRAMVRDPAAWRAAEDAHGFSYAVVEYDIRSGNRHFPMHLNDNPGWALVYWDDHSAVYLKDSERNRPVIAEQHYQTLRPNGYDLSYVLALVHERSALPGVLAQIEREIAYNPDNQEPRLARVLLLHRFGDGAQKQEALQELRTCLELAPDLAMEHSALAFMLHEHGRSQEARRELEAALEKDPLDPMAQELKRVLLETGS